VYAGDVVSVQRAGVGGDGAGVAMRATGVDVGFAGRRMSAFGKADP
jgi:hypothetical protein